MSLRDNNERGEITVSSRDSKPAKQSLFKSRGFRYGSLATIMTALVIVVVIAVNMVLSILSDRYSWALDFTSTHMYDISDATKQAVNSLDKNTKIDITVFYNEKNYPQYLAEPIKRFANLSENINVTYVDPEKQPAALNQYGTDYNVASGAVVVTSGKRVRVFNTTDYLEQDQETGAMYIYLEEKLAAGVLFVTKDAIPTVYFVTGHGEDGYQGLSQLFANNGAEVKEINLMTDKDGFDSSSRIMVICDPRRDYSDAEIRKIQDFVVNDNNLGRSIMYFSATDSVSVPNLEKYLREWGVAYNNDFVLDSTYCVNTFPNMVISEFTTEELMSTGTVLSTVTSPITPNSRSINLLFAEDEQHKTQKLITTIPESSYAKDSTVVTTTTDKEEGDKNGPFTVAAVSMRYKYINNVQVQSYLFASGSADMLEESVLTYSGNGEYIMQLYKIMVDEQDDTILSARKSTSSNVFTPTPQKTFTMVAITVSLLVICFATGLIVFIRRRFK